MKFILDNETINYIKNITPNNFDYRDYFNNVILHILLVKKMNFISISRFGKNNKEIFKIKQTKNNNTKFIISCYHSDARNGYYLTFKLDLYLNSITLLIETSFLFNSKYFLIGRSYSNERKYTKYPRPIQDDYTNIEKMFLMETNIIIIDYIKSLLLKYVNNDIINIIITEYLDVYLFLRD